MDSCGQFLLIVVDYRALMLCLWFTFMWFVKFFFNKDNYLNLFFLQELRQNSWIPWRDQTVTVWEYSEAFYKRTKHVFFFLLMSIKGIVHAEIKISWKITHPQAIQDIDEFVSSSEQIGRNSILHQLLCNRASSVNGCRRNESPNSLYKHHTIPQVIHSILWNDKPLISMLFIALALTHFSVAGLLE